MKTKMVTFVLSLVLFSQTAFSQWCSTLIDVSVGEYHTLALDSYGYLWACGGGGYAKGLGNVTGNVLSLQRVLCGYTDTYSGYLENVTDFDAGWYHSLAVTSDGRCYSFGTDTDGQLGNGSESNADVPTLVHGLSNDPSGLRDIVKVSAGRSGKHSLALDLNGYVYAWGSNASKQCGGSSQNYQYQYPELVLDSDSQTTDQSLGDEAFIVDIEAGINHSLALTEFQDGGFVYEWGNGTAPHKVPGQNGIGYLSNVVDIATCGYSLAVDINGNVWYWTTGGNPTKIAGGQMGTTWLENITKVAAGNYVAAALDSNGNVWEWTGGSSGSPVKITDGQQQTLSGYLEDIAALDVGYCDQRIAIDTFGNGWGWGNNVNGSLGIGNETSQSEPVKMLCAEIPNFVYLEKTDNIEYGQCADLNTEIVYTIEWRNNTDQTFYDVYIKDVLPTGVTVPVEYSLDPNTLEIICSEPFYQEDHTYVYPIGTLDPNDSGVLEFEAIVNSSAPPGYYMRNTAEIWATLYDPNGQNPVEQMIALDYVDTPTCCWLETPEVLFVDRHAAPGGNGLSWDMAFKNLQDALDFARNTLCGEVQNIYVAQGTYYPGDAESDTFDLQELPGIALYGGFPTGGCDFSLRNPKRYQTILSGKIDDTHRNATVLRMGNDTYVEGLTITESAAFPGSGLTGCCGDFTVVNSRIARNDGYGAFIENSNATFKWCNFVDNKRDGISHTGEDYSLILENCVVQASGQYGIFCIDSTPQILNSILSENDFSRQGRAGIYMENPKERPYIQNCTVSHNKTDGIVSLGNRLPNIHNSIVFHNGGPALVGFSADEAAMYSCIEDANSINGNIAVDPEFLYFDPNNVRLSPESDCRHASNPYLEYVNQMDMDGNPRVTSVGLPPDMGAYEVVCDINVSNAWDWNADGLVNYSEFNGFSKAWMGHDPNDPAWLANPAIRDPNLSEGWYEWKYKYNVATGGESAYSIDLADVLYLAEESPWLWRACWVNLEDIQIQQTMLSGGDMMLLGGEMLSSAAAVTSEPVIQDQTVQEQMLELASAIVFLEQIWLEEPDFQQQISAEDWQEFMDTLRLNLLNLQTGTLQTE